MIDIHSKRDNMGKNGMFYALICINNHIIRCIDYMLSINTSSSINDLNEILGIWIDAFKSWPLDSR